ncbi:MAG: glycosyltransferase family 2 protein [Methylococcaceae bacterium]
MELSIIIVNWNGGKYIPACLDSIKKTGFNVEYETIVVDNASDDGSPDFIRTHYPDTQLIANSTNLGFAAANNMGMALAHGRYFCLINPDVIVKPDCLKVLNTYMNCNPDTGIAGPRILNTDHTCQKSTTQHPGVLDSWLCAFFLHRIMAQTNDHSFIREVPVLYGMFWIISRSAWLQVGGLDERFFMYGEDLDWCKRFSDHGFRVVHVPYATAIHAGGGCSRRVPIKMAIQIRRSRILYFIKHHGVITGLIDWSGLMAESFIRILFGILLLPFHLGSLSWISAYIIRHGACLEWLVRKGFLLAIQRPYKERSGA